jgi:hypothetical protein
MNYKVNKLNFLNSTADFNLAEEGDDICKLCSIEVPREKNFIGPVCIGDAYVDLCPRCAKGIRNLMLRQKPGTDFPSDSTNRLYNRFMSWLAQTGRE